MLADGSAANSGFFPGIDFAWLGKAVFYLSYALLITVAGIGLWQLKEWARRLALAMQVVGLVQLVVFAVRPSLVAKYSAEINGAMGIAQPEFPAQFQNTINVCGFGMGALVVIATAVILHYYRGAFRPRVAP